MQAVSGLHDHSLASDEDIPDLPIEQEESFDKPKVMNPSRQQRNNTKQRLVDTMD